MLHPKYRPDIDGLRAIAVLMVVGYHAFPEVVKGGFAGVDIFFVISGFLISTILLTNLRDGTFSLADFYIRRVKRIFPALILVLLACYFLGYHTLFADEYKQLGKHIAGGAAFIPNLLLWSESGYFDNAAETKPLLHLWSLGVEEQFYLIWPMALLAAFKRGRHLFAIILAVLVGSFVLNIGLYRAHASADFYSPLSRFWELACGALLAFIQLNKPERLARWSSGLQSSLGNFVGGAQGGSGFPALPDVGAVAGIVLVVLSVTLLNPGRPFPGWWALLPTLGASCLIASGPHTWVNRMLLSNKVLVAIGLISYPLYLWHWPLLTYSRIVESATPNLTIRLAAVALSLVLAWLTYLLLEIPIRRGTHGAKKALALCAVMICVGIAGYATFQMNGLPSRDPAANIEMADFEVPYKENCDSVTGGPFKDDWCHLSEAGNGYPVLLMGDSQSNGFSTVLSALRKSRDFSFAQVGRATCPLLSGYGPKDCVDLAEKAAAMAAAPHVKTVILAGKWPQYYPGISIRGEQYTAAQFRDAFLKTIAELDRQGKNIVIVNSMPYGATPRSCLDRPFKMSGVNGCKLPLQQAKDYEGHYRDFFLEVRQKYPNIRVFDPWTYLCDRANCLVAVGHHVMTVDGSHLSVFGGQYLASKAQSDLLEKIKQ